jgi:hypothetical protein
MTLKLLGIFLALCIPFLIATIWAIVDVAQPFVGFIVYLIFGFRKGKKVN